MEVGAADLAKGYPAATLRTPLGRDLSLTLLVLAHTWYNNLKAAANGGTEG